MLSKRKLMRRNRLFLFACALLLAASNSGRAQGPGVSLGFHNGTHGGILVQGTTNVKGLLVRGQPFLVTPGKTGFDSNLPPGSVRFITIFDATQPARILLPTMPVQVSNRDHVFTVRPGLNGQVMLAPKK